jgi:hypothetical protein
MLLIYLYSDPGYPSGPLLCWPVGVIGGGYSDPTCCYAGNVLLPPLPVPYELDPLT